MITDSKDIALFFFFSCVTYRLLKIKKSNNSLKEERIGKRETDFFSKTNFVALFILLRCLIWMIKFNLKKSIFIYRSK